MDRLLSSLLMAALVGSAPALAGGEDPSAEAPAERPAQAAPAAPPPPDGGCASSMICSVISGEKCSSTISMNLVKMTPFIGARTPSDRPADHPTAETVGGRSGAGEFRIASDDRSAE